jgi:hypothetical protein
MTLRQVTEGVWQSLLGYDRDGLDRGFGYVSAPVPQPNGSWVVILGAHADGEPVARVVIEAAAP